MSTNAKRAIVCLLVSCRSDDEILGAEKGKILDSLKTWATEKQ